jgi:hypothetical protein
MRSDGDVLITYHICSIPRESKKREWYFNCNSFNLTKNLSLFMYWKINDSGIKREWYVCIIKLRINGFSKCARHAIVKAKQFKVRLSDG